MYVRTGDGRLEDPKDAEQMGSKAMKSKVSTHILWDRKGGRQGGFSINILNWKMKNLRALTSQISLISAHGK